jgi:ubiquinone/menaquinone biosynthesis C-methylase UbiE
MVAAVQATTPAAVRDGYRGVGQAWSSGPAAAYERMADAVVAELDLRLEDRLVLDLGAGTGAASRCIARAGGRPIALDIAHGMLLQAQRDHGRLGGPALGCAVGQAECLPFAAGCFDAVIAAFSLSHLPRPLVALQEARRVLRPAGRFISASFGAEPAHPAKACVENIAARFGFQPPRWYAQFKQLEAAVDTPEALKALASAADLVALEVAALQVDTGVTTAEDLVRWRLGMAHLAPFMAGLPAAQRAHLEREARAALGPAAQPWRPMVLVLSSRAPT